MVGSDGGIFLKIVKGDRQFHNFAVFMRLQKGLAKTSNPLTQFKPNKIKTTLPSK